VNSLNDGVNRSTFDEILALCDEVKTLGTLQAQAEKLGARSLMFGFQIVSDDYPYEALDLIVPEQEGAPQRRLFIHENFDEETQLKNEGILATSGLRYFNALLRGNKFTARETPLVTMRMLDHNLSNNPASKTMSQGFLAPELRKLFQASGLIPDTETLRNLVHVEQVHKDTPVERIETGVRFIPPYAFEPVEIDTFIPKVLTNAAPYGSLVLRELEIELTSDLGFRVF
jgi:hypothetical protein